MERIPYSDRKIQDKEPQRWKPGEFLIDSSTLERAVESEVHGPEIETHINQNGRLSFKEFDEAKNIETSGYNGIEMRSHGCGISCLHMALSAMDLDYQKKVKTVGQLALSAMSLHRNDNRMSDSAVLIGNPVFNLKAGWYHDALIYTAEDLANVEGARFENITFEDLAKLFSSVSQEGRKMLAIISVKNKFWRIKEDFSNVNTHLVILNGYKIKDGKVSEICVTDPYVEDEKLIVNKWIEVDDRVRSAFNARAMCFTSK